MESCVFIGMLFCVFYIVGFHSSIRFFAYVVFLHYYVAHEKHTLEKRVHREVQKKKETH